MTDASHRFGFLDTAERRLASEVTDETLRYAMETPQGRDCCAWLKEALKGRDKSRVWVHFNWEDMPIAISWTLCGEKSIYPDQPQPSAHGG